MLKLKKTVCKHLLGDWLNSFDIAKEWKLSLRAVFKSHEAVRAKFAAFPGQAQADTAWLVGASPGLLAVTELLDKLVYTGDFDGRYRDAIKSKHELDDFLAYPSVAKELQEVEQKVRAEAAPQTDGQAAADPAAPDSEVPKQGGDDGNDDENDEENIETAKESPETKDNLSSEDRVQWRRHMLKHLQTHVRLVPDQKTEAELTQSLQDQPFTALKGDPTGCVLIVYDQKKYGESTTRPDLRGPTLRESHYSRLVRSALKARSDGDGPGILQPGDIALILDGGKPGLKSKFLSPWKQGISKDKHEAADEEDGEDEDEDDDKPGLVVDFLTIAYSEESLAARKKRLKGTCTLKQLETCYVLAPKKVKLPCRPRKHYPGSSTGDLIQGVGLPKLSDEWTLKWSQKKDLYGKKHLIAVGGKTEGGDDEPKVNDRAKDAPEPVCYFSPPIELMEELLHTFFGKMVVDLSPADGKLAFACLQNRVAYLGVTYNEVHSKLLEERLLDLMQTSMADPSSPLFNNNYAQAIGVATHTPTPKPKPKPGPKAKTEIKKGKQMRLGSQSPSRKPRRLRSLRLKK